MSVGSVGLRWATNRIEKAITVGKINWIQENSQTQETKIHHKWYNKYIKTEAMPQYYVNVAAHATAKVPRKMTFPERFMFLCKFPPFFSNRFYWFLFHVVFIHNYYKLAIWFSIWASINRRPWPTKETDNARHTKVNWNVQTTHINLGREIESGKQWGQEIVLKMAQMQIEQTHIWNIRKKRHAAEPIERNRNLTNN